MSERVTTRGFPFENLPNELQYYTFKFLALSDLGRALRVCKHWHALIAEDEGVWKNVLEKTFMLDMSGAPKNRSMKQVCRCLARRQTIWLGECTQDRFVPYGMVLGILDRPPQSQKYATYCRWPQLRNSKTGIILRIRAKSTNSRWPARVLYFREESLLEGKDIAIPADYHGLLYPHAAIGVYKDKYNQEGGFYVVAPEFYNHSQGCSNSSSLSDLLATPELQAALKNSVWAGDLITPEDPQTPINVIFQMDKINQQTIRGHLSRPASRQCELTGTVTVQPLLASQSPQFDGYNLVHPDAPKKQYVRITMASPDCTIAGFMIGTRVIVGMVTLSTLPGRDGAVYLRRVMAQEKR